MRLILILAAFIAGVVPLAIGQTPPRALDRLVVDCAVNQNKGSWVDSRLDAAGTLRFNYLYEPPPAKPGEFDYADGQHYVYAAFWNQARTQGTFLQFIWFPHEPTAHLRIVNNAQIVSANRRLELQDSLWGVWTYEHLMRRLTKLQSAPIQSVSARNVVRTGAVCDSYASAAAK